MMKNSTLQLQDFQKNIQETFNKSADHFDNPALPFWDYYGRNSVERTGLKPGMHVLDLCTGSGASAIPAAELVGPEGKVIGVDLAQNLLELAQRKAESRGLINIDLQIGDMTRLPFEKEQFDAVIIVFGIFFEPEMEALLANLYTLLKPGGTITVTTWQKSAFQTLNDVWQNEFLKFRTDPFPEERPWERVTSPDGVQQLFLDAGINNCQIESENRSFKLEKPEDWWSLAQGSGFRAYVELLDDREKEQLRAKVIHKLVESNFKEYDASVIYAKSTKPIK